MEDGTEQWFVLVVFFSYLMNLSLLCNRPLHFVRITVGNQVKEYLI
jgi:hypothetical protein